MIISGKNSHNGSYTLLDETNNKLIGLFESEKNNNLRYTNLSPITLVETSKHCKKFPNIFCISGWHYEDTKTEGLGYRVANSTDILNTNYSITDVEMFGNQVKLFQSTHELSHIMQAYGMSPFNHGQKVYCLVYEGSISNFYYIDEKLTISKCKVNMNAIGTLYTALYNTVKFKKPFIIDSGGAGKLMALISYADLSKIDNAVIETYKKSINLMINQLVIKRKTNDQVQFILNELNNIGILQLDVTDQRFCDFAKLFSDTIIQHIISEIKPFIKQNLPLLISGGCGLNCDWNTVLRDSKLFTDIFVAPCTDDSGSSLGTAIEALYRITGNTKIKWDVYAGEFPHDDSIDETHVKKQNYDSKLIAKLLFEGEIIPVIQGRAEIGPRALGNRSILTSPLNANVKDRLNTIKQRETYRPVAPIVLREDAHLHFEVPEGYESPYMLFFEKLTTDKLPGITHVDNSARIQTVAKQQNKKIHNLLKDFKELSGYGVLCNTSLNFKGRGFLNKKSDLLNFCKSVNLKWFIFEEYLYEII